MNLRNASAGSYPPVTFFIGVPSRFATQSTSGWGKSWNIAGMVTTPSVGSRDSATR